MNALGNVLNEVVLYKKIVRYFFISFVITFVVFFFTIDSVFAAIGMGGATCTAQSKTTGTSLACTVATENIEVGNTAVLFFGGDNTATVDGNDGLLSSVTDSSGNTWTVQRCYTNSRGAAGGGATTCIATSYITTQLTSGASTITANFSSIDAKAIVVKEFTTASGYLISATGTPQDLANTGADPGAQTISGLPSGSYLFVRSTALERAVTTWTATAGFTTSGCNTTTGAGAASNNGVCGEFIIASATTTATSDPIGTAVDNSSTFIAFVETTFTTITSGTDPAPFTVGPGSAATSVDAFTLKTSSGTDIITSVKVTISNASSTSLVEITNDAGTIVYGSTVNPTGASTTDIILNTNTLTATSGITQYKIRVTPKTQNNLPTASLSMTYPIYSRILSWTGTNVKLGTDGTSSVVTIDNEAPSTTGGAGFNWTIRSSASDNNWFNVTYGNGLFVAVSQTGTGNRVMTSPDGITWTSRTSATPENTWLSVTYGNGLFVAVADSLVGTRVMTSPDGINWTSRTSAADNSWYSVAYGNGLFVAVSTTGTGNRVMTSPDGITWTSRTSAADNGWGSITYGNGLFVALGATGTGNRVMTSPDGINWTIRTSAVDNQWFSVTYGNGLFVGISYDGIGNRVMTSPDGINWTSRTSAADNSWTYVTYGNGLFVAVADSGTGNRVMTSPDGINWTIRTSAANNTWNSVTYGNGLFVAVAWSGTGNRVMTSSSTLPTIVAGDNGQVNTTYTTPGDSDLNSIVILRATSTITDVPVDGTTYTGGETIGSATVACVDTTVSTSTADSCLSTGLTVGVSYHFKVFAKDSYGNYSTGLVPTGSPILISLGTTTLSNGTNPANVIIAPGATATSVNAFAFQTSERTETITGITLNISNASSTSLVEITNDAGSVVYGSTTNPTGTTTVITLTTNIIASTTLTQYKVRITPKSHAELPSPSLGMLYPVTATVSTWTGTNNKAGSDATSATTTIDNESLLDVGGLAGVTWATSTSAANNSWIDVAYGNGLFVAVAYTGVGNRVMTSPDGITWTSRTSAVDNQWYSVTYGNGLFVAVAGSGTGNRVMTSPDGITWTSRTSAVDNIWNSVTYGNSLFVAVSSSGSGNRVMTSPDGITWTSRTSAVDNGWKAVTYGNGLFVAVSETGTGDRVMVSSNGINWSTSTSASDSGWKDVTYGNGLFVAVANSGAGNRVMTSPDGITWTSRTSANDNNWWYGVAYGNSLFVALSMSAGVDNQVMTSPDGITWTSRTSAADTSWPSVVYGNSIFVAVSWSGTNNRVMISTSTAPTITAGDGSATTSYTTPGDADLNSIVILRSTSAVTDVPVEGTTYIGGETIGSATVACVDTSVSTSTSDSCLSTGLTGGVAYHFKVFAKDSYGNYSTGIIPAGSPVTPPIYTNLSNDTNPSSITIAPGATATSVNAFAFKTSSSTDIITSITLSISSASSTSLVEITDDAGSIVYGSTTNPTGTTTVVSLSTNITVTTATTTYKVRITPKSQADLPSPSSGVLYPVTATVSNWVGTNNKKGSDSTSATTTIDNLSTTEVSSSTVIGGDTQVITSYTTPTESDLNSIVVLRSTSAITGVPVEGTTYTGGETIGSATVACVDTTVSTSTADSCTSTGLTNGTPYHFKVFAKDSYGNYSTGLVPTGSPATPAFTISTTTLANTTEVGNTTIAPGGSATFVNAFTLQTASTTSIDTLTDITLNISNASSTALVEVTNSAGTTVYGSTTNPTGTTTTIILNQNSLTVTSALTTYKIRITPKTQANLPHPSKGTLYPVTATVSTWTGTNNKTGSDATSSVVIIDNDMPSTTGGTGVVWATSSTSGADNSWLSVAYGNGIFVAVADTGIGNRVMTSTDGITWTLRTSAANNSWKSVTYGNGVFVAVAQSGSGNDAMTSPDGITWTLRTTVGSNWWKSVTFGKGLFVAVAQTGTGDRVMTSPDGITWTSRTSAVDSSWQSVAYGNGLFVAVATGGTINDKIMTSPDGVTWTARTSAVENGWQSVTYGDGMFVTVGYFTNDSTKLVMTSLDGITWNARTSAANNAWSSVTYGNGTFVAVSTSGTGDRIMRSYDGITWSTSTSIVDNQWQSVAYGNGLLVVVSNNGTGNGVMTSTSTLPTVTGGDGKATTTYTTPGDADLNSIVILRSTSPITDVPVEGTTYTGGETIGSAIVACVDTTVSTSTADSCLSTGLTNGVPYYFKVFAKDSYGNYSTGLVPTGSPVTPAPNTTTLNSGVDPSDVTIYPGGTATSSNSFTFQTSTSTDSITSITLNISNASSTSLLEITNDAGSIVYGSSTNPTGTTTIISLSTNITANTTLTQYKVRITPKSQINMPRASLGMSYTIKTKVTGWTGSNVTKLGSDTSSTTITIDNLPPATSGNSGINWSTSTSIVDNSWQSVAYGNGTFVAIAQSGTGDRVMTSPDGVTWTSRTSSADNSWKSITYADGLFVAISYTGTGNRIMTSPNGITWTSRTSAVDNNWKSITYGNGTFVAVSDTGTSDRVMASSDGITWSTSTSAVDSSWQSVAYGNNIFVAIADSGANQLMTSPDGITWTARNTPNTNLWRALTFGNNIFVAVSQDGVNNRVMTSPDGINWTLRTSADNFTWTSVTYGNGIFVAVASDGGGQQVMTSYDGYSWTLQTSSADNLWNSVAYGNGVFVAVSNSGSSNRVMTSTSSAITVTAGDTVATTTYTTPGDLDLHSIIVLTSTSTITDFPVEGITYTGGEIIGSSTVSCVDTSIATTTSDSCVSTGLTNGTTYYFKVFARDNYGNYSSGITPVGSPSTPNPTTPTVTLGDGSNPSNSAIAPGGATTTVDAFTFSANTGTPTVTAVTVAYANASSTSRIQITNDTGSIVYGSTTNPTGTSTIITLNTPITTTSSSTQYKIQIVPKSQSQLPEPNLGLLYPVTATIINFTTTALVAGTDPSSATITIDNVSPLTSATTSTPTAAAGNTQITISYTTPADSDLNSMVVLRSSSAVSDSPVEGTSYTGGETIGSATVACVDTTVSPSTIDSCIATGLTNGVSYYFKLFAKDSYGNYSTGTVPTNSPIAPIPGIITVTLGDGVESGNTTVAPGSSAINNNSFTLQADYSTSSVSAVVVTLENASSTSLVEITNNAGSIVYGSTTNPTGATTSISLSTVINIDTNSTQYKIRITPKSQANLPGPSTGIEYTVTSIISAWTVSTGTKSGVDATSSVLTIDNLSPSNTSTSTASAGNAQASISYTNPSNSDLNSIVVLRSTSAVTDVPVEGSTYIVGNTIGSATVACVDTSVTPGASDLCFATSLVNGTPYYFKVYAKDSYGNYSTGTVPGGSPVTPSVGAVNSRVDSYRIRKDNGGETSATYYSPENSEINSAFFNGDAARIRFVISNQGGGISNMSYRLEYSSSSCTTWVTVPKVTNAVASDPVRTSTSYYVSDGGLTTHSSGVSVPSGKSFVPGYIQTFDNITLPITINTNEYTEVEFMIRTTSAMTTGTPYCFRVTDAGDASSFTYLQTPSIISKQTQFRPQAGGGGGGYLLIIEADTLTGTTTVTGGGANGNGTSTNEATTTPNGQQSTTTPSQGGDGGGDLGFHNLKNNFAYNYSSDGFRQGIVLGATIEGVCVNFKNSLFFGKTDAITNGEVSELQYYLKQQGYFNAKETGYFGHITELALKNYQKNNNITVTGFAGKITRDKMKINSCYNKGIDLSLKIKDITRHNGKI